MTRKEKIEQQALLDEDAYVDNNYHAFKRGVEWSDENPKEGLVSIDKVCAWIEEHMNEFCMEAAEASMISWLRKAMEE